MNITTPSKYSHALMTSHNGVIIKEGAIIQEDNGTVVVWLDPVRFAVCFLCPTAPHIVKTWSLWKLGGRCCSGGEQSKKDFWSCCMNALSFKGKKREDRCLLAVLLKKKKIFVVVCFGTLITWCIILSKKVACEGKIWLPHCSPLCIGKARLVPFQKFRVGNSEKKDPNWLCQMFHILFEFNCLYLAVKLRAFFCVVRWHVITKLWTCNTVLKYPCTHRNAVFGGAIFLKTRAWACLGRRRARLSLSSAPACPHTTSPSYQRCWFCSQWMGGEAGLAQGIKHSPIPSPLCWKDSGDTRSMSSVNSLVKDLLKVVESL